VNALKKLAHSRGLLNARKMMGCCNSATSHLSTEFQVPGNEATMAADTQRDLQRP